MHKADAPIVSERSVVLTELEELADLAPADNDALEVHVSVIVAAQASNVDLTDAEPHVVTAWLDKRVFQENVLELVHLNVFDQMERSELVVGTDVVVAAVHALLDTDAVMEFASATRTVKINIVEMMVVEEAVELANKEPFAKEPLILILNNATSTAILKSELKFENSRPTS